MLGLDSMTEEEMETVFNRIDKDGNGVLTVGERPLLASDETLNPKQGRGRCYSHRHGRKSGGWLHSFHGCFYRFDEQQPRHAAPLQEGQGMATSASAGLLPGGRDPNDAASSSSSSSSSSC